MPLPVVKHEICAAMVGDWTRENFHQYFDQIIERLRTENPVVIKFLEEFAGGLRANKLFREPAMESIIIYSGAVVYRLLESQMEADELEKEMG